MSGSQPATESAKPLVENLDTATAPFQETTAPATDAKAESSPANETGETRETLLEVTRRALQEADSPPADATTDSKAPKDGEPAKADAPDEAAKPDPEADKTAEDNPDEPPPFHKHPRWQQLQRDRAELSQKVETLAPLAERQQQIQDYMAANDLTPEDVRQGFAIMAALRQDPAEAWKLMEPIVRSVRAFMGDELPTDLQERVDTGLVDEDTARELAQQRHRQALQTERQQRQAQRQVQQQTATQAAQAEEAVVSAVDGWWSAKQAHPDAASIAPFVHGETLRLKGEWAQAGRRFDTPQAATALMDEVWTTLQKRLAPARRPIRTTPGAPPSPAAPPSGARPATLKDALRAAI